MSMKAIRDSSSDGNAVAGDYYWLWKDVAVAIHDHCGDDDVCVMAAYASMMPDALLSTGAKMPGQWRRGKRMPELRI